MMPDVAGLVRALGGIFRLGINQSIQSVAKPDSISATAMGTWLNQNSRPVVKMEAKLK